LPFEIANWVPWLLLMAVFAILAVAEALRPRRALKLPKGSRWRTHALFFLTNSATGRLLAALLTLPLAAEWSVQNNIGLMPRFGMPYWLETVFAFVLLDFAVWLQHLAMHRIPVLWRMHKVHHADRDLDVTTALRFHPFELIVSTVYKSLWVVLMGVPAMVVLAFEAWLNANALFNHSNVKLPGWLDRTIRPLLVTPDMHLVHHSTLTTEQHRNYGFALTLWDRLFGTYADESELGRDGQAIGLAEITDDRPARFGWSLKFPMT
jgi:sterol desaturase/sphingolipid hydroxylase (fatty acid hydroxylase superfamily)